MLANTTIDPDSIRTWLIQQVAYYAEMSTTDIEPTARLASYGMDSVYALSLCADIEDRFDLEIDPTLAWDHPTVEAITEYLTERLAHQ